MNRPTSTFSLRRLLALAAALIMLCALLAGCGKDETEDTKGNPDPSETATQTTPTEDATEPPTEEPTEAPTEAPTEPPVVMGTVNADNLNVRTSPATTSDILKRLAINSRVEILEQKIIDGVNWGRIPDGWINLNYVTIDGEDTQAPSTGTTTPTTGNAGNTGSTGSTTNTGALTGKGTEATITTGLNIRKSANADSDQVGTYAKGDKVEILEQKGNWGRTDKGWINLKYTSLSSTVSNNTSSGDSDRSPAGTDDTVVSNGKKTILGYGTVKDTTSLGVRTGPGTKYTKIGFIRLGDKVAYYQKSGNWVRIKNGWVSAAYLEMESSIAVGSKGTVTAENLNIRKEASSSSEDVGNYTKGTEVTILEVKGNWGRTDKGWISLNYVSFTSSGTSSDSSSTTYKTGTGTITADYLHIRKAADGDSESVGTYSKGDKVEVTEISGKWGKTSKGWISMKYVKMEADPVGNNTTFKVGEATVKVNTTLTIRKEAKTEGEKVGSYANGDKVTITEVSGEWGKTDKGWINLRYVKYD